MQKKKLIDRDISWLSFNERVLQEAADTTVPLRERIRFLGIFSNNLDEFFKVRVATLKKMSVLPAKFMLAQSQNPKQTLERIQEILVRQQYAFEKTWQHLETELKHQKIFIRHHQNLTAAQQKFVVTYFNEQVRSSIIPLMIENIQPFPTLNDGRLYLACKLYHRSKALPQRYALIAVPVPELPRFVLLPSEGGEHPIILLEEIVRFCMPIIFSSLHYNCFTAHIIKLTRDAALDIDNNLSTTLVQKIEKGIKNRKRGKPVRVVFDKAIDTTLLSYLVKRLGLTIHENLVPGGPIHNFKDFIQFPDTVFPNAVITNKAFTHPLLKKAVSVTEIICKRDVLLHFPYHRFETVIDLLREAAIDDKVQSIKISCYRLADESRLVNALINAARNGKRVTVALELRARFDEEANLYWKKVLEDAGIKVLLGLPHQKIHAKVCLITKKENNRIFRYGFISTGNMHETTAQLYGDLCLLTSNRKIMADMGRIFTYLAMPKTRLKYLSQCKTLWVSPTGLRAQILLHIKNEIVQAMQNRSAAITLKLNSLSDPALIDNLEDAARAGVRINLIVRGIFCLMSQQKKFKTPPRAISIVDGFLEHARLMTFENAGTAKWYISSADWMPRNMDYRVEVACPILDTELQQELCDVVELQLADNVKARILDNTLSNEYVPRKKNTRVQSQQAIYKYLLQKKYSSRDK